MQRTLGISLSTPESHSRLALRPEMAHWRLTTLRERLVKIGAKLLRRVRQLVFQMTEVAVCLLYAGNPLMLPKLGAI